MSDLIRYRSDAVPAGSLSLPFSDAVEADGWLHVSGQVGAADGGIVPGGIVAESQQCFANIARILTTAGYGWDDVVRVGVWLDDPRDFWLFNRVFREIFGDAAPARACVRSSMMLDCKVEVDCVAFRADRRKA
ncbi:RidA family protein [Gluconacetobacter tumulisoli]|uniref:RidA family protein n=1 Tax=Gluconacetobacter tumulisoli TaxID=1286189 RepID=A0A7W4K5F3_9PROT|nr:RidA family protein [Gluconacetobacter tumulisoli]MBB2200735.1 RidA family protein [Gluconacetobacter tumulisoli]